LKKKYIYDELENIPEFKNMNLIYRKARHQSRKFNLILREELDHINYGYYCTHCNKYHYGKKINVGTMIKCPFCKTRLKVGTKRNNIETFKDCITYAQKNRRKELIFRVFYYEREYDKKTTSFNDNAFEIMRINVDRNIRIVRYNYTVFYEVRFKESKGTKWKRFTPYYQWYHLNFVSYICNDSLSRVLKNTQYQYSALAKAQHYVNAIDYLKIYEMMPILEMIVKFNMTNALKYYVRNVYVQSNADEATKFLKENKRFYKFWRQTNPDVRIMQAMVDLNTYDDKFAKQSLKKGMRFGEQHYTNDIKLAKYLVKSNGDYTIWKDYIEFLEQLEVKIDKSKLFPKDLMKAHDKFFNNLKIFENKEYEQDIIDFEKMINPYNYKNDSYIIRCAKTVDELVEESSKLNHCVRNYIPKISAHQSAIFFVRKQDNMEEPYITVEVDPINKVLIQCRAISNKEPPKDVMNFIREWCESRIIDYSMLTYTT
jgi:hypothetical protein